VRICLHWYVCTFVSRCYSYNFGRHSVFGITTTLRAGRTRVRIPVEATDFIISRHAETGSGPTQPLVQHVLGLFCERLAVHRSPPSSTEIETEWSPAATPPQRLHVRTEQLYLYTVCWRSHIQQACVSCTV